MRMGRGADVSDGESYWSVSKEFRDYEKYESIG